MSRGAALPRLAGRGEFLAADELDGRPHICVDGRSGPGVVLELSHWPACTTPRSLGALTATQIVARYLDAAPAGPEVSTVSNNHVDVDGLLSAWLLLNGPTPRADLAIAAAEVGDFGTWRDPVAAQVAFTVTALVEPSRTPLPEVRAALGPGAGNPTGPLHRAVLPHLAGILWDPDAAEPLWRPGWDALTAQCALLDSGAATITDIPELDLAVIRTPRPLARMAWAPRTPRMRVLSVLADNTMVLEQRYETWVAFTPCPVAPRVDLAPAADSLNTLEPEGGWRFEGLAQSTPRLLRSGSTGRPAPSVLDVETVVQAVAALLAPTEGARA